MSDRSKKKIALTSFIFILLIMAGLFAFEIMEIVSVEGQHRFYIGQRNKSEARFEMIKNWYSEELEKFERKENPDVQELIKKYNRVLEVNKEYLDQKFTVNHTSEGKRKSYFKFLDYAIKNGHCGLKIKQDHFGFILEDVIEYYQPKITSLQSDDEFIFYCDEMISVLDDGHTYIDYKKNELNKSLEIGITKEADCFVVSGFYETLKGRAGNLDIEDYLLEINGSPAGDLYNQIKKKTIFAQYPKMEEIFLRRFFRSYYFYMRDKINPEYATLTFAKKSGERFTLKLPWKPTRSVRNMYGVRIRNPKKQGINGKILDNKNIGYIKIDKWDPDLIDEFNDLFDQMKNTSALILDVRNNFGGDYTNFGQTVISKFLDENVVTLYKKFKNSELYHRYGFAGLHYQDDPDYKGEFFPLVPVRCKASQTKKYQNPVVLLVNQKHFSSNDLFITAFYDLNLGPIIGRINSFQMLGQPIRIKTPWNDWGLGLSVMIHYSPKKILYEDKKIRLDRHVPLTKQEIFGKKDPILSNALDYLKKKPEKQ